MNRKQCGTVTMHSCVLLLGTVFLISLDDINAHTRESRNTLLVVWAVLFGLWLLFVIASSYVMTNADRYPRLVKLFVKPEYLVRKSKKER